MILYSATSLGLYHPVCKTTYAPGFAGICQPYPKTPYLILLGALIMAFIIASPFHTYVQSRYQQTLITGDLYHLRLYRNRQCPPTCTTSWTPSATKSVSAKSIPATFKIQYAAICVPCRWTISRSMRPCLMYRVRRSLIIRSSSTERSKRLRETSIMHCDIFVAKNLLALMTGHQGQKVQTIFIVLSDIFDSGKSILAMLMNHPWIQKRAEFCGPTLSV